MIYFLVPVYNEVGNAPNLHRELTSLSLSEPCHFVFSDDGSTDGSREKLAQLFEGIPHVVLGDGINRGPGAAFQAGFDWILANSKSENDAVVTLEADCTSDLGILPVMLTLRHSGFDLVLASVYAQGGGFDKTSLFRRLVSATANFTFRFLFNVQVLTLSSFYRVYTISLLHQVQSRYGRAIEEAGFICMLEILIKSLRCNARVIEVPMKLHSSKRVGASKMKVVKTTLQYFRFLFTNRNR